MPRKRSPLRRVSRASEHVAFVPLTMRDVDDFMAGMDDDVLRWQNYTKATVEKLRPGFGALVKAKYFDWPCSMAVRDRTTDAFLGTYALANVGPGGTSANLGWWLCADARGRGLGNESLGLALEYAHTDVHIRRIIMGTRRDNERAVAQIRRAGAVLKREATTTRPNGQVVDALWFEHTAS
jgi:RimJ/RimL family protein N-acetyltransferase